jgi:hypothetical protein
MTWRRLAIGELSWETLRLRSRILEWTRRFFRERGFLEVDPPIAQPYPNIDPNVFPVAVSDASGRISDLYLHTSPELSMKKLLAAGSGNIFSLGKVFRDRERRSGGEDGVFPSPAAGSGGSLRKRSGSCSKAPSGMRRRSGRASPEKGSGPERPRRGRTSSSGRYWT